MFYLLNIATETRRSVVLYDRVSPHVLLYLTFVCSTLYLDHCAFNSPYII